MGRTDKTETNEMDVEMSEKGAAGGENSCRNVDEAFTKELTTIIDQHKLLSLLVRTIQNDDENSYQDADRIEHVYNSVKLIRNESLRAYLQLVENFYLNREITDTSICASAHGLLEHMFVFMDLIARKSEQDLELSDTAGNKNECVVKLVELVYDLFVYFDADKSFHLSIEQYTRIVELAKAILLKFKVSISELCVRLARIVGLVAIHLRNNNLDIGKPLIKVFKII